MEPSPPISLVKKIVIILVKDKYVDQYPFVLLDTVNPRTIRCTEMLDKSIRCDGVCYIFFAAVARQTILTLSPLCMQTYNIKGGTPDFDLNGWLKYVDERRVADPGLSDIGKVQAKKLAAYLQPHLTNQASKPVRFVVSPMCRTIETILPTIEALNESNSDACEVMINALYFESEGCHTREKVEQGMNAEQINETLLYPAGVKDASFVAFPKGNEHGWYANGTGPETRPESEERAAKFYVWLMEWLDAQLLEVEAQDVYDAGYVSKEISYLDGRVCYVCNCCLTKC